MPLAEIARPHGVRGEVKLKVFNEESDLLLELDEVLVRLPSGEEHEVSVDVARRAGPGILMKLYSVDDRDRADELRGALVCARRREFPELAAGEFYACDVVGAKAFFEERELGTVRELQSFPAADTLVIDATDGGPPYEVPLVDAFVESVDVAAQVVKLRTLEGIERG